MKTSFKLIGLGMGLSVASIVTAQSGPSSPYYLASGTQLWTALGTNAVSANTVTGNEFNIAVDGDIRTTGERGSSLGQQYNLSMASTGTTYAGAWLGFFDGATDGVRNYSVNWDNGDVVAFDRNWQSPTTLFNLTGGSSGGDLGITYDGAGGLWISQWNGSNVNHYSMNGTLLGGFSAGFINITSLAMDYKTGTLWMGTQTKEGTFSQFTTSGTLLQTITYSNLTTVNTLGGEFDFAGAVPEPASIAAIGIGVLALLRRKRSK